LTAANITTISSGHILDAMCFLLGEFSSLTAQARCVFPSITTPHHAEPVSRDAFDTLSVQGVLESGATATFHVFSTTSEAAPSITWIITGKKGSLKFDGQNVNIQMVAPDLFSHYGSGRERNWERIAVDAPMAFGQVGEVYSAFASGEKAKGCLVDFKGAALRHRMLEACFKSSRDGTRETYEH
jgi:predicted dehydrogenase